MFVFDHLFLLSIVRFAVKFAVKGVFLANGETILLMLLLVSHRAIRGASVDSYGIVTMPN